MVIVSEKQFKNENIYNADGIDIIVSEVIEDDMSGISIDYDENPHDEGFVIAQLFL